MSDDGKWFAPKRYGLGIGVPISWRGWAVLLGYITAMVALCFTLKKHPIQLVAAVIPLTIAFVVISARTTRGGWRWRWGDEE